MNERRTFKVSSPAKLNLTFSIVGSLPGGYHEVETLLQAVDLEDELRFAIEESTEFELDITMRQAQPILDFPLDRTNLIGRAAELYLKNLGVEGLNLRVEIKKAIPIAAGMGGGSSNAAATLLVLNRYFKFPFPKNKLEEIAAEIGSDVPFFIHGGAQIGRHRGDKLSTVPTSEKMYFTIVNPREISIATAWIYKQYDRFVADNKKPVEVSLKNACSAREDGSVLMAAASFGNVFESIVYESYPELHAVREKMLESGAMGCFMTGSGPTLFALCDSEKSSAALAKEVKRFSIPASDELKETDGCLTLDVWPTVTIDRGPTVVDISPQSVRQRR